MMHLATLFFIINYNLFSSSLIGISKLPFKPNTINHIEKGVIVTNTQVQGMQNNKIQKLNFKIAGLHKRSCSFALRKLSHYESFHRHLSFVKSSSYDEKKGRVNFYMRASILPFNMRLNFKIPRMTKTGVYPFTFDRGLLKGLKGNIHVSEHKKRCLFFSHAHWQGKHSGINGTIFEFFTNTLTKLAMKNLFRISSIY